VIATDRVNYRKQVCLLCMGQGHKGDAEYVYHDASKTHIKSTPTRCPDCRGKGIVYVVPIPDEDD